MQKCIKKRLCLFNKYGKITNVKLDYLSKARENAKGRSAGAFWLSIFVDNQKYLFSPKNSSAEEETGFCDRKMRKEEELLMAE